MLSYKIIFIQKEIDVFKNNNLSEKKMERDPELEIYFKNFFICT